MSRHRDTPSRSKRPVDIVTGPIPTVEELVEQDAALRRIQMKPSPPIAPPSREDLEKALHIETWLKDKFRRSLLRYQGLSIIALGYGLVITYLWVQ